MRSKGAYVNTLAFKPLYNYLKQQGHDVVAEKVLQMAGVSLEQIGSHEHQCPIENFYNAYHLAISMTGDDLLGLHIGRWLHPSNMGLLGYAMLNCANIQEALYLVLSSNMHGFGNETIEFGIEVKGNTAKMTMHTKEDCNWIRPWIEFTTAGWISHYHHLTNFIHKDTSIFKEVAFPFSENGHKAEYEEVLGCPVLFDQPSSYITGDISLFEQEIYTADKSSLQVFMDQLGISEDDEEVFALNVKTYIKANMVKGMPDQTVVAKHFGMSVSTLKRRLKECGTTYGQLCRDLRKVMARKMLANPDINASDIAFMLGYTSPAPFFRAFKIWEGVTPLEYRKRLLK